MRTTVLTVRTAAIWAMIAAAVTGAIIFSWRVLDMRTALFFAHNLGRYNTADHLFATPMMLSVDAFIALALILVRIVQGRDRIASWTKVLMLACLSSLCVFALNDAVLKWFFGVPNPWTTLFMDAPHAFNLTAGTQQSSFPSGHMMLVSSFAGVFMRVYRRMIVPLSALLIIATCILVVGDWHFVSDVIAGTALGIVLGLLAGTLWIEHSAR